MWIPSEDEAVEMFARHFEARHRSAAVRKADEKLSALKAAGDDEGYRIWQKVAERVKVLREPERVAARRELENV